MAAAERASAPPWQVWSGLAVVYVVWGSTYLAIRYVVATMPPLLSAGGRFLTAAALLAGVLVLRRGRSPFRASRAELLTCALVGLLFCLGGNGLLMIAEQSLPSGFAALIVACMPLFVVVLRRLGGDHPSRLTVAGVLMGVFGVGVLLLPGTTPAGVRPLHVVLQVLVPLSWSIGAFVATRRPLPADPFASSVYEMAFGGVALLLVGALAGEGARFHPAQITGASWLGWGYLVLAGSVLAFTAYVWLLGVAPMSMVATFAFVNPVVAVILGAAIAGEAVTAGTWVGGVIIVVAVAVVVAEQGRVSRRGSAAESEVAARLG